MTPAAADAGDHPAGPHYTVAGVARQLGIAPGTLRTWDRRYGLGPSQHQQGQARRYSPADVARLAHMQQLVLDGVAPADAARLARADTFSPSPAAASRPAGPERGFTPRTRLATLPSTSAISRLGSAAQDLDGPAVQEQLEAALAVRGVLGAWDEIIRPVLTAVGERWAQTGEGVEVEHLLSEAVIAALRPITAAARRPAPGGTRAVVLAAGEDDSHSLPLHAVAAALAERGVASRLLGAAVPTGALAAALRRTGSSVIFIWSQFAETAHPEAVRQLPLTHPPSVVVVGGPGWAGIALPAGTRLVTGLEDAVDTLQQLAA